MTEKSKKSSKLSTEDKKVKEVLDALDKKCSKHLQGAWDEELGLCLGCLLMDRLNLKG